MNQDVLPLTRQLVLEGPSKAFLDEQKAKLARKKSVALRHEHLTDMNP